MKRNKERKRILNRRSMKKKFGIINNDDDEIKKPVEDASINKNLRDISNITGIKVLKKKGFLSKIIEKVDGLIFPRPTEEQIKNLSFKKKLLLYLLDTRIGKYISNHYAYVINNGDFLKRIIASNITT